jgi:hypothetical protein
MATSVANRRIVVMVDDDDGIMLSFAVGGILKKWQWVF